MEAEHNAGVLIDRGVLRALVRGASEARSIISFTEHNARLNAERTSNKKHQRERRERAEMYASRAHELDEAIRVAEELLQGA